MIFNNIKPLNEQELREGEHVVILKATRIPPHIGLLINGTFYELSVRGTYVEPDLGKLLSLIHRRALPTLFVKVVGLQDGDRMAEIIKRYESVSGTHTCLSPIKEYYSLPHARFVFEVLPELQILGVQHSDMDNDVVDGKYEMKKYTTEDIMNRIAESKRESADA